jgi:hypothetical protein
VVHVVVVVVVVAAAVDIKTMTGPATLNRKVPVLLLTSPLNRLQLMDPIHTLNVSLDMLCPCALAEC